LRLLNTADSWIFESSGGTQVSVPVYSLHHNAAIFPDPHAFIPERWLPHDNMTRAEKEQLDKLKNFCIPFSTGPRACIGRNIVYLESLMLVATLVHRYDFELPSEDWRMDTRERLNINPAALWVRVKKREGLVG
jgi:benzoate 4-monooxygenase